MLDLIMSIPWPFWGMLVILAVAVVWTLIEGRADKPKEDPWDHEFWTRGLRPPRDKGSSE